MPSVPRFNKQTQERPLGQPATASGVQQPSGEAIFREAEGLNEDLKNLVQFEIQRADQVRINEAKVNYENAITDMIAEEGQNKLSKAIGSTDRIAEREGEIRNEVLGGLNRAQAEKFHMYAEQRGVTLRRNASSREGGEVSKYDKMQLDALLDKAQMTADPIMGLDNPEAARKHIQESIIQPIEEWAIREGHEDDSDTINVMVLDRVSKYHQTAIDQLHAMGDYLGAKDYLNEYREEMTEQDEAWANRSVRAGSVRGRSQEIVDGIFDRIDQGEDGLDERAARDEIRENIDDPEVRDAALDRLTARFSEEIRLDKQEEEAQIKDHRNRMYSMAGAGISFEEVFSEREVALMTSEELTGYKLLYSNILKGERNVAGRLRYEEIMAMVQEEGVEVLLGIDPTLERDLMQDVDSYRELMALREAVILSRRTGDTSAVDDQLGFEGTFNQLAEEKLTIQIGRKPIPSQLAEFKELARRKIRQAKAQLKPKEKFTAEEMENVIKSWATHYWEGDVEEAEKLETAPTRELEKFKQKYPEDANIAMAAAREKGFNLDNPDDLSETILMINKLRGAKLVQQIQDLTSTTMLKRGELGSEIFAERYTALLLELQNFDAKARNAVIDEETGLTINRAMRTLAPAPSGDREDALDARVPFRAEDVAKNPSKFIHDNTSLRDRRIIVNGFIAKAKGAKGPIEFAELNNMQFRKMDLEGETIRIRGISFPASFVLNEFTRHMKADTDTGLDPFSFFKSGGPLGGVKVGF